MPTKQTEAKQTEAKQHVEAKQHIEAGQAVSIVLIETNGTIKTLKTKEVSPETLYKKCGFRVNDDFLCRHTWKVKLKGDAETMAISIWAKKTGKANFENKYDLPPPLDKELFFGTCAIVRTSGAGASGAGASGAGASGAGASGAGASEAGASGAGASGAGAETFIDLTKETWLKVYEQLFGGFEDIGDEDEYSEDELENVDPSLLTAHGYLKDDFVVSDKDALESGEVSAAEEIEVVVAPVKKKRVSKTPVDKPIIKKAKVAKPEPAKSAPAMAKSAPAMAKSAPATTKSAPTPAKPAKTTAQKKSKAKKTAVEKTEEEEEEAEEDVSELEEEVYTFSDDD